MKKSIIWFITLLVVLASFWIGRYFYFLPGIKNGDKLPLIEGEGSDGRTISSANYEGTYWILHFWGSWCPSCRKENALLKELYASYKGKLLGKEQADFDILSVGAERNEESWLRAIEKDSLDWPGHIIAKDDFKHPILQKLEVRRLPTLFLIDPKGIVIASDPDIHELKKILTLRTQTN